jgi:hypothetical protein
MRPPYSCDLYDIHLSELEKFACHIFIVHARHYMRFGESTFVKAIIITLEWFPYLSNKINTRFFTAL